MKKTEAKESLMFQTGGRDLHVDLYIYPHCRPGTLVLGGAGRADLGTQQRHHRCDMLITRHPSNMQAPLPRSYKEDRRVRMREKWKAKNWWLQKS